jgi:hypothetical protein
MIVVLGMHWVFLTTRCIGVRMDLSLGTYGSTYGIGTDSLDYLKIFRVFNLRNELVYPFLTPHIYIWFVR